MRLISLLLLSGTLAAGHIVPRPQNRLFTRAGQEAQNLDNEEPIEDPVSGNKIDKTRILTGLGPEAADNRYFDWDESCTDAKERQKIVDSFSHLTQLSQWTSEHLGQLLGGLPKPVGGSSPNKDNQKFIFQNDPAYAQMFLGHDNRIQYVKDTFDLVTSEAKKSADARGGNKPGALRFICNSDNHVKTGDGAEYCGTGGTAAQAIATPPYDDKYEPTIELKYSFTKSSSITFCPSFFDDTRFPNIDVHAGSSEQTLDKIDSRDRVMLHEYMHLPWTRNMPGTPDYTGYFDAADYARAAGWGSIKNNPDNYAWLAVYAYFNREGGCGNDVWPSGEDKPNKSP